MMAKSSIYEYTESFNSRRRLNSVFAKLGTEAFDTRFVSRFVCLLFRGIVVIFVLSTSNIG